MSPTRSRPTFEQVRALPELHRRVVPPEFEDFNGHMSIAHHMAIQNEAGPKFLEVMGLTEEHLAERRTSIFDAEHHLLYMGEVMVGDEVAVHGRMIGRSEKAVHGIAFLADLTREELSSTLEWVSIHVDLDSRRPAPWPDDLAALIDDAIARDDAGWEPPLCGSMGVSREPL